MAKEKDTVIVRKERRLSDLYVNGKEVVFDLADGEDPLTVWVQKLTPAETQEAVNRARPAKSRITSIKRLPEDASEWYVYYDQIDEYGLEKEMDLIQFLIQPKLGEYSLSAEARIAAEKEWADDDYLIGLQTAWTDGMDAKYAENPEDPEAERVYEELKRYTLQVQDEIDAEEKELIYELQDLPLEELRRKVASKLIEDHGDNALLDDFRKNQMFFATRRGDDHNIRYFDSVEEINTLQTTVYNKLLLAFIEINVDSFEGKE